MASSNSSTPTVQEMFDDVNTHPPSFPSICIPRVFSNISEARIRAIFNRLKFGEIEQVDMVEIVGKDGKTYNRVFVHFKEWWTTPEAQRSDTDTANIIRTRHMLINGQQVKMIYDEPWFWLLSKSHSERPEERKKRKERPAPRLDFNTDDYVVVKSHGVPAYHSPC